MMALNCSRVKDGLEVMNDLLLRKQLIIRMAK